MVHEPVEAPRPPAPPAANATAEGTLERPGQRPVPGDLVRSRAHGDSRLRRVGHGMLRAFQPSAEVQSIAEFGEQVQRPITTGRRIAVMGVRGGAGKSTVTALIASVFAHYRQDRVLALDVDPDLGSLPLRLGAAPEHAIDDLARGGVVGGGFEDVRPYLAQGGGERLWVLPAALGEVRDSSLEPAVYEAVAVPLSRFFGVTITDCGADPLSELNRTVLAGAHAQILVAPTTPDGATAVGRVLDWQRSRGLGDLAARTLVVFTVKSPAAKQALDLEGAAGILGEAGAGVQRLGYDRHVAVGTALDPRLMGYATRVTAVRLAAGALRRALEV
ncbi:hypothetical protein DPM19_22060 [Actinomadura craniellae]|uniref:CobQ/CobB/MinD/ParA nucleotide binding domain-containing protein n=1 Tax=Actinomadura craniellae TaxID=2231787 RepID=A0A365H258_9ACTN|nr:hypothetical protein DPM19_22060 [Actinomadura craniellae]